MAVPESRGWKIEFNQREVDILVNTLKTVSEAGWNPEVEELYEQIQHCSNRHIEIGLSKEDTPF